MVQLLAQIIEKSAGAADNGSDLDRVLVYLQAHSESCNLCRIFKHCFVKEGQFCWTSGILLLANKHIDLILENPSAVDILLFG